MTSSWQNIALIFIVPNYQISKFDFKFATNQLREYKMSLPVQLEKKNLYQKHESKTHKRLWDLTNLTATIFLFIKSV